MGLISIEDIAHVRFAAPDVQAMRAFLIDFGLEPFEAHGSLYARGGDGRPFVHVTEPGNPAFLALGLRAASVDDLGILASATGVAVEDFDAPGGGKILRFTDPDGFKIEVIAGQDASDHAPFPTPAAFNTAATKERLRALVRFEPGPAHVFRIGHCVLNVSDFRTSEKWYKDHFGFLTSDEIEAAKNVSIGAFMRCNRGDRPSDHHTVFLAQFPQKPQFLHAAFEVLGLDDLMLGHDHLKAKGRTQAWGVGRHIMGSQIFDYWRDPWGHELEHWTDGDLLTADIPPQKMTFQKLLAVQWGAVNPLLAGKMAPPPGLVAAMIALVARIKGIMAFKKRGDAL